MLVRGVLRALRHFGRFVAAGRGTGPCVLPPESCRVHWRSLDQRSMRSVPVLVVTFAAPDSPRSVGHDGASFLAVSASVL